MAEEPAPQREGHPLPVESENSSDNSFWKRIQRVEALLIEARELLEELKEGSQ